MTYYRFYDNFHSIGSRQYESNEVHISNNLTPIPRQSEMQQRMRRDNFFTNDPDESQNLQSR